MKLLDFISDLEVIELLMHRSFLVDELGEFLLADSMGDIVLA